MKKIVAIALAAAVLSGCADTRQFEELNYTERKAYVDNIFEICKKQGVTTVGEMATCYDAENERESRKRQEAKEKRQLMGAAMIAGSQSYGNSMRQSYGASYSQPIRCTSNTLGGYTNTTCY